MVDGGSGNAVSSWAPACTNKQHVVNVSWYEGADGTLEFLRFGSTDGHPEWETAATPDRSVRAEGCPHIHSSTH
jgi:hypothetical protein